MLSDSHGRSFHYLRLSVTDVCNFRCNYCLPDGYACDGERDFLRVDEIARVAHAFAALGTSKIRITGGEPSLRKDLPDILAACARESGIETLALTTNGFKLYQQAELWRDAGLNAINVSIDSLDPRQFSAITGHNKLEHILAGVDRALTLGFRRVKVNCVLMREYHDHDLEQFLNWLKHMPVTLRFIELMQTGDNTDFFQQQHVNGSHLMLRLQQQGWQALPKSKHAGPAIELSHRDYAGRIGFILPYSPDFCQSCNRLRVSSRGDLHLCLFAEQGLPLRHLMQSDNTEPLQLHLQELLQQKHATHYLHQQQTGGNRHFAMLGG